MKSRIIKRGSSLLMAAALMLSSFLSILPIGQAYAVTEEANFKKTGTSTEELAWDADLAAYIASKKAEWQASDQGQGVTNYYRQHWEALFVADSATNTYKYPVWKKTSTCDDVVLVGDTEYFGEVGQGSSADCAGYLFLVEYDEVTVTQPTSFTVKFDTGSVLPDKYRLVDQTVAAGDPVGTPQTASGETMDDFMDYCNYGDEYPLCYNGYQLEGTYIDPDFNTHYNGNPITQDTTIYFKWIDNYSSFERIKNINISIVPPKPGTVITVEDEYDWDTQNPQLEVALPSGLKYRLYVDDVFTHYAYWLKGSGEGSNELFTGVIEKGGKYYAEIWFLINDGELALFDRDLTLTVNGVNTPFVYSDYDPDYIGIIIEIDIPTDEPESETDSATSTAAAPNSGAFTASSSAAPAASGSVALFGLAYFFLKKKFNKR